MLELKTIKKDYPAGNGTVAALKGIDLQFRKSEFVAILGPSGCGKTTMLNIIGGSVYQRRSCHQRKIHQGLPRQRLGQLPKPFHRLRLSEL